MNMMDIVREGFKIVDGRLCDKFGVPSWGTVYVNPFGWGSPCIDYRFDDYDFHEYSIYRDTYGDWYLMKDGYTKICRLNYFGGKNWST